MTEKIATQEVEIKQEGSTLHLTTLTRGLSAEEGGYHWSGEMRLWDNEILMGWYASNDGSIRSKGTMYFVAPPARPEHVRAGGSGSATTTRS